MQAKVWSVAPALSADPLHVTLTPKKLKTGIGSTVILSCALSGSPEYIIRWYRNTELVVPDHFISIRGISNETLLITAAQKSHSGAYQCLASRKGQTAQDFAIIVLEGEQGFWCGALACSEYRHGLDFRLGSTKQASKEVGYLPIQGSSLCRKLLGTKAAVWRFSSPGTVHSKGQQFARVSGKGSFSPAPVTRR